jgi:hypothetical protein
MNKEAVGDLLLRWSRSSSVDYNEPLSPHARVVTGNPRLDALIYQFERDSGIELLTVARDEITDYRVVDQRRWVEFVLKYA